MRPPAPEDLLGAPTWSHPPAFPRPCSQEAPDCLPPGPQRIVAPPALAFSQGLLGSHVLFRVVHVLGQVTSSGCSGGPGGLGWKGNVGARMSDVRKRPSHHFSPLLDNRVAFSHHDFPTGQGKLNVSWLQPPPPAPSPMPSSSSSPLSLSPLLFSLSQTVWQFFKKLSLRLP